MSSTSTHSPRFTLNRGPITRRVSPRAHLRLASGPRPDRRARATRRASICVASVSPDHVSLLSLIESLAFRRVGEQLDEIDGLECVFERQLPLSGSPVVARYGSSRKGA